MRRLILLIATWSLLFTPAMAMELQGECKVRFTGSSTLHDFEGTGSCEPFVLRTVETAGAEAIVPETILTVTVAGMQTGNSSRDQKMREMFGADRYPLIAGVLGGSPVAELRQQLHDAARGTRSFPLRLRIRDVEAPTVGRVTQLVDNAQGLNFDLEFPVSLAAYRLEPPSVLGLIRVADEVRVKVSLHLAPLPIPSAVSGGKGSLPQ